MHKLIKNRRLPSLKNIASIEDQASAKLQAFFISRQSPAAIQEY